MSTATAKKPGNSGEKKYLTPEERSARATASRTAAKAQQEQMAEHQRQFNARLAQVTDEEADRTIRALPEADKEKLRRFAKAGAKTQGIFKIEEKPTAFWNAQRAIIKNLIAAGMSIGEIDEE